MTGVTAVVEGALYALCNPYVVDGRVTWHPPELRGFSPMNSYVLTEGDDALIIDTGISAHTDVLLAQLGTVLNPAAQVSVIHTRVGEFPSICNTQPIAERFTVTTLHDTHEDCELWVDFRTGRGRDRIGGGLGRLADARVEVIRGAGEIAIDRAGRRTVKVFPATLRLLPTTWLYDPRTCVLFTSDVFSHVTRSDAEGPWLVTGEEDRTTLAEMRRHLLSTRYWWLPGARTEQIRADLATIFARHDVQTIAPGYGCLLQGRDVVLRHCEMLDQILAEAQTMPPLLRRSVDAAA